MLGRAGTARPVAGKPARPAAGKPAHPAGVTRPGWWLPPRLRAAWSATLPRHAAARPGRADQHRPGTGGRL